MDAVVLQTASATPLIRLSMISLKIFNMIYRFFMFFNIFMNILKLFSTKSWLKLQILEKALVAILVRDFLGLSKNLYTYSKTVWMISGRSCRSVAPPPPMVFKAKIK